MSRSTDSTSPAKTCKRNGPLRGLFALRHSYRGFVATVRHESAFRQELIAAMVLIPSAAIVPLPTVERVMLVATTLLVLLVELVNSGIEATVDRISPDRHELSGRAKDCGSAAVTVAVLICAIAWITLCGPLAANWIRSLF
ncbi:diacylglycerol kinase [Paraburkholderia diazotrophica]|uniref:Diacylglycerol kinase n=1 Tax=Paraburkholderia diazotrophica TaxID=667676 RepID=A0A1H6SSM4_9BURK|nr:diacylglycerol kinase [Paraburkholderia diazotrophica]SEI70988.1 diacylglycerol kinase [Paraburkholderia diazotrophica]